MIDLARWSRVERADGSVVLTAPASHPGFAAERHATLRIRNDAPLATLDAFCAAARTERLVTEFGEYGAFRQITDDDGLCRAVGLVAGEDRMTVVDGVARSPNIAALVRDVLVHSVWIGAFARVRMVPYRVPAGWFGVRRHLRTCWIAPRDRAVIVVFDAVPRGPAERTRDLMAPPFVAIEDLGDAQWSVRVALQAGDDRHLAALHDIARSIELPTPPARRAPVYRWMAT